MEIGLLATSGQLFLAVVWHLVRFTIRADRVFAIFRLIQIRVTFFAVHLATFRVTSGTSESLAHNTARCGQNPAGLFTKKPANQCESAYLHFP